MRTIKLLIIVVVLTTVGTIVADQQPKRVMNFIAVLDLNCGKIIEKEECSVLTDIIIDELVKSGKYTVIDRANRDKILAEARFQMTGCTDESCTIEAGRLLGVGKIVTGKMGKLGNTYVINLQLINVETAAVEISASEECKCDLDGLINTVRNAARKLMGQSTAQPQSQPVPPVGETPPKPEDIKFIAATPEQKKLCLEGMVYIPAGWFMMGCNEKVDSQCESNEYPYHPIYLDAFCIDMYQYPNEKGKKSDGTFSWLKAQSTCISLGKRLPTEAEWEKASRGTDGRIYPWGNVIDAEKQELIKTRYVSGKYSWHVSPYGVYDTLSNVAEWTADRYDENYYQHSPIRNPTGSNTGNLRVIRGSAWNRPLNTLRISYRSAYIEGDSLTYRTGMRCAKTP